jgi:hypothetical protein
MVPRPTKQGAHHWYEELKKILLSFGFKVSVEHEKNTKCLWTDHWRKGICVINIKLLSKTLGNESCLVTRDFALCVAFMAEYPAAGDDISIIWGFNKLPGTQFLDFVDFLFKCSFPIS